MHALSKHGKRAVASLSARLEHLGCDVREAAVIARLEDVSATVRETAARTVATIVERDHGEAVAALIALLDDTHENVREVSVCALAFVARRIDRRVTVAICSRLSDTSGRVRDAATRALSKSPMKPQRSGPRRGDPGGQSEFVVNRLDDMRHVEERGTRRMLCDELA